MWLMVMFDLPVSLQADRKEAADFRNDLLDYGFERCQFSVYVRFCEGREQADTWVRKIQRVLPVGGKVYCLFFTDKQYQGILRFEQRKTIASPKNPDQFILF
jgi:CRISPR-associated protein Cas2